MKVYLFTIPILVFLLISCDESEEIDPNLRIAGKYQYTVEGNMTFSEEKFNFVNTFEFQPDGNFLAEDYTTAVGSDVKLGYRGHYSGIYVIVNGELTLFYTYQRILDVENVNYASKDELGFRGEQFKDEYAIEDDFKSLNYICSERVDCVGLPYKRVE
jgi:hypothetical protein